MTAETDIAAEEGVRRAWLGVGAPILGLVGVIILLAVATLAGFARDQDRVFAQNSQRLVASAIGGRANAVASVTLDYANWDAAYRAMSASWDGVWVESNIYSSAADAIVVFRADGAVRYAWHSEATAAIAEALTAQVVRAGIATPHLRQLSRAPTPAETVVRGVTVIDGKPALIAVAPVTLEDNSLRRAHRVHGDTYIAMVDVLSASELADMGATLGLHNLAFAAQALERSPSALGLSLQAATGARVDALTWRHDRPGLAGFQRQIVPAILALLVIGALAVLIARIIAARQIRALANARAALESSRLKSDFLTRVSHELRTPLNAIIGYAEIIQEEHEDKSLRDDSGRIITAARHLGHLLDDIFDQSRLDAGRVKLNPEVLPVAGLLAELQGLVRPTANANGVTLNVAPSARAGFIVADHTRLRQCLINLAGNAIKFAPKGNVTIAARAEMVEGRAMVAFDIVDDGIGISKNEVDNLFRPFSQANAGIGMRFGGAGLGLSISRDLARAMGGEINVVSELGQGATFTLMIPAATANTLKAA